jgi:hypothetical protein
MKLIIWLIAMFSISIQASVYEFGSSCSMQGAWTSQAMVMSQSIRATILKLKDDPNCTGLINAFSAIEMPTGSDAVSSMNKRDETNSSVDALSSVIKGGNSSPNVLSKMLGSVLDRATLYSSQENTGPTRAIRVGLDSLSSLFDELPNADLCLHAKPALGGTLLGGAAKMLSAYAASGETNMSGLGSVISKFVNLMRNKKFSSVISQIDEMQFSSSISCILESTTENYCRVKDAYELLDYAKEEKQIYDRSNENTSKYNPLEGYFILTRETPIISEWIQKVMFGVTPRTNADSTYKNQVLDNVNGFLKSENALTGAYSERVINYHASAQGNESKKNHIMTTIKDMMKDISSASSYSSDASINFFTETRSEMKIAFDLIGMEVPQLVAVGDPDTGRPPLPWTMFMENGGAFIPAFDDPDALLIQIGVRLEKLIINTKMNASSYFQQRLIVDKQNLVDQSMVSQTVSVYDSFRRIDTYLDKLISRALESGSIDDKIMLSSMIKTKKNIENILEAYRKLNNKVDEIIKTQVTKDLITDDIESSEEISELILDVIKTVYLEFNVILQRDTFIMNRMNTYVRYDYMYYTKRSESLSDYQKDLLVVAGKNIIDILGTAYQDNPALIKQDLANAQVINMQNLKALEDTFRDKMFMMISRFRLIANGKGDGWFRQAFEADRRFWRDSLSEFEIKYKSVVPEDESGFNNFMRTKVNIADPFKLVYRYFANKDRYYVTGRMFERSIIERDDTEGSWEQMKSRFCMQTLPFTKYFQYHYLCEDSILSGLDSDVDKLNLSYNKLYQNYVTLDIKARRIKSGSEEDMLLKERYDDNVCALRNFRRRNYAHWLTKQVAE